jgi:hypothetical protein
MVAIISSFLAAFWRLVGQPERSATRWFFSLVATISLIGLGKARARTMGAFYMAGDDTRKDWSYLGNSAVSQEDAR